MLDPFNYDKNTIPGANGVDVTVEVTIQKIADISEFTQSFKTDVWFSQIWLDERLDFSNYCEINNLSIAENLVENFWTPNVNFVNSKFATIHSSPKRNVLLLIFPNGTVWLKYRVRVQAPCKMDLTFFPMVSQS